MLARGSSLLSFDIRSRKFTIVLGLLLTLGFLYAGANYLKYGFGAEYDFARSLSFNLILFGGFSVTLPVIWYVTKRTADLGAWSRRFINLLLFVGLVLLYVTVISLVFNALGFLSRPLHGGFFTKYFSNIAIIHLVSYVYILKEFSSILPKNRSRLIEVLQGRKKVKIKTSDILFAQSLDHYVKIRTDDNTYLKKISMPELLKLLKTDSFVRIHRSHVVNKRKLKSLIRNAGTYELELEGGHTLRIGKTYLDSLRKDPTFTYL